MTNYSLRRIRARGLLSVGRRRSVAARYNKPRMAGAVLRRKILPGEILPELREGTRSRVADFNLDGLAVSLAALGEPGGERRGQALRFDTVAGLERPIAGGQRVVEFGRAGEIAHAETIQPIERAGTPLAPYNHLHLELLNVHS